MGKRNIQTSAVNTGEVGLDRLLLEVVEDVVAAGRVEQVREEAVTAARVASDMSAPNLLSAGV